MANKKITKITNSILPPGYSHFLKDLKMRIKAAQMRAVLSVNHEMTGVYWYIGKSIVCRQQNIEWGNSVVDQLAVDIHHEFPGIEGFSPRNIWRMRAFYKAYTQPGIILPQLVAELDGENLPQAVAEIPWGHNIILLEKLKLPLERIWYARAIMEYGWSRSMLVHHIGEGLINRQAKALSNFNRTLPPPQSDLAQQALKDPYLFDFVTLYADSYEKDLEQGLLSHIQKFLVELGVGFAFVGRQVRLEVSGKEFYLDLLFYHLRLRCYVVIELKAGEFKPEYAGKLNFYLSAVDDIMKHPDDKPSIGLILCKAKDRVIAEYALRDIRKPIGIANWRTRLIASLPKELKGQLPTIKEIEKEFGKDKEEI